MYIADFEVDVENTPCDNTGIIIYLTTVKTDSGSLTMINVLKKKQ